MIVSYNDFILDFSNSPFAGPSDQSGHEVFSLLSLLFRGLRFCLRVVWLRLPFCIGSYRCLDIELPQIPRIPCSRYLPSLQGFEGGRPVTVRLDHFVWSFPHLA